MKLPLIKKILALVAVYLLMTLALYGLSEYFFAPKPIPPQEPKLLIQVDIDNDWIRGQKEAPITLVEYADFQCPACQQYEPLLQEAQKQLEDQLKIVFRQFPIKDSHPRAEVAALVAEAAGKQGKFWEMHDKLFAGHAEWEDLDDPNPVIDQYAKDLNLSLEAFKADLANEETQKLVDSDLYGGMASGIQEVPAFFLNGTLVKLPTNQDELLNFLQDNPTAK